MNPWFLIDIAPVPGGEGELRLMRRGDEFSIMLGQIPLMNTRLSGSEVALATRSIARLEDRAAPEILIGGLGMGFTLRAALAALGPDARVTVVELVPAVVRWALGPLSVVFQDCLADPRVSVVEDDIGARIKAARASFDAILLDVDNGPDGLTLARNDSLYGASGLKAALQALRPSGVLSVWSVAPDKAFATRMRNVGFAVEEISVRANAGKRGARHVIWIGRRP